MWKKPDIEQAIKYFKNALELDPKNKTSLRSLSMIVRTKETKSNEEKKKIAQESLDYAKKAINLDMKDSNSWYVYGNAYFYKAFIDNSQYNDLRFALSAYNKSQEKISKYKNPDLFYNRGVVHAYLENYEKAYEDFKEANNIDETLKSNELCDNIINNVKSTCKLIKNQCSLKPKKLAQIVSTIPKSLKDDVQYQLIHTSNMQEGVNHGKLITGKIVTSVQSCFEVPISLVCVDYFSEFICLSLYNISKDFLQTISYMSSTFVVLNPVLKKITMKGVEGDNKVYEYNCVQITDLSSLLVDGKFCSGYESYATLNSTFFN
jgi:hypothetical protein